MVDSEAIMEMDGDSKGVNEGEITETDGEGVSEREGVKEADTDSVSERLGEGEDDAESVSERLGDRDAEGEDEDDSEL